MERERERMEEIEGQREWRGNQESLVQFENGIKPRVYVRLFTRSTMYEKATFC